MKFKPIKERMCRCGCERPVEKFFQGERFKGYARFAKDCLTAWQRKHAKHLSRGHKKESHHKWKPQGTRRLQHNGNGVYYWFVKVNDVWIGEHRHIMQKILNRTLHKDEHVHHKNHDTLNNSPDNLCVLSRSEHTKHHLSKYWQKISTWTKKYACCIDCGTKDMPHSGHGRCRKCRGKYEQNLLPKKTLIKQWAFKFSHCTECKTTERKHQGHGFCTRCYGRKRYHNR